MDVIYFPSILQILSPHLFPSKATGHGSDEEAEEHPDGHEGHEGNHENARENEEDRDESEGTHKANTERENVENEGNNHLQQLEGQHSSPMESQNFFA